MNKVKRVELPENVRVVLRRANEQRAQIDTATRQYLIAALETMGYKLDGHNIVTAEDGTHLFIGKPGPAMNPATLFPPPTATVMPMNRSARRRQRRTAN